MKQLTLRGFDQELEQRIRQIAEREQVSMNAAALKLMRRGAGLDRTARDAHAIGARLDDFIGSWSAARAQETEAAMAIFEEIDPEHWR